MACWKPPFSSMIFPAITCHLWLSGGIPHVLNPNRANPPNYTRFLGGSLRHYWRSGYIVYIYYIYIYTYIYIQYMYISQEVSGLGYELKTLQTHSVFIKPLQLFRSWIRVFFRSCFFKQKTAMQSKSPSSGVAGMGKPNDPYCPGFWPSRNRPDTFSCSRSSRPPGHWA